MDYSEVYAVDFDRTLNMAEKYPELGEPNVKLIKMLIGCRAAGDKVILWTCREGELLEDAVEYCRKYGLEFDAINDNIQENKDRWGNNTRKVFADFYIDDRNLIFDSEELKIALTHPAAKRHGIKDMAKMAEKIIRKHMNDGWIPAKEKPAEDGFYVATMSGVLVDQEEPFVGLAEFEDGEWVDGDDVIAWRPLPEPYRPESETKKPDWREDMLRKFNRRE